MGSGSPVHPDVKRAAIRLCQFFSPQATACFLGISDDTVRRALKLYEETGDVLSPSTGIKRGRKPMLNEGELAVSKLVMSVLDSGS